MWKALT